MPAQVAPGLPPISKSQRNKSARDKKKKPIEHGGTCSACGQSSTSSTTGGVHIGCSGFYNHEPFSEGFYDRAQKVFSALMYYGGAEQTPIDLKGRRMRYDGLPYDSDGGVGCWCSESMLTPIREKASIKRMQRLVEQDERDALAKVKDLVLECQNHWRPIVETDDSISGGFWTDGFGVPREPNFAETKRDWLIRRCREEGVWAPMDQPISMDEQLTLDEERLLMGVDEPKEEPIMLDSTFWDERFALRMAQEQKQESINA